MINCNKLYLFLDTTSLSKHFHMSHVRGAKPYKCDQCTFTTSIKRLLTQHTKKKHAPVAPLTPVTHLAPPARKVRKMAVAKQKRLVAYPKKRFECCKCDMSFVREDSLA